MWQHHCLDPCPKYAYGRCTSVHSSRGISGRMSDHGSQRSEQPHKAIWRVERIMMGKEEMGESTRAEKWQRWGVTGARLDQRDRRRNDKGVPITERDCQIEIAA